MCSFNVLINDFTLPFWRVKSQSDLYVVWKCFNFHIILLATLSYSKIKIIQLLREESAPKSTVISNTGVGKIFTRAISGFFRKQP